MRSVLMLSSHAVTACSCPCGLQRCHFLLALRFCRTLASRFASTLVVSQDLMVLLRCADRLFWSIQDTWKSVTTFPTDVKELIPEFYSTDPSFLTVSATADFGQRSSGKQSASNLACQSNQGGCHLLLKLSLLDCPQKSAALLNLSCVQ